MGRGSQLLVRLCGQRVLQYKIFLCRIGNNLWNSSSTADQINDRFRESEGNLRGQGQKTVLCNIHCTDSTADIFKKDPETKMASLDKSSLKIRRVRLKKNIL